MVSFCDFQLYRLINLQAIYIYLYISFHELKITKIKKKKNTCKTYSNFYLGGRVEKKYMPYLHQRARPQSFNCEGKKKSPSFFIGSSHQFECFNNSLKIRFFLDSTTLLLFSLLMQVYSDNDIIYVSLFLWFESYFSLYIYKKKVYKTQLNHVNHDML